MSGSAIAGHNTFAPNWSGLRPMRRALGPAGFNEVPRTNLVAQSTNFTIAPWITSGLTIVTGQPGAPDGTASFTRIVDTSANISHYINTSTISGLVASAMYTVSVYACAQQNRYLQLGFDDLTPNGSITTFDLLAGVISGPQGLLGTGATLGGATIQAIGGGTYRCTNSCTIGPATSGRVMISPNIVPQPPWLSPYAGNTANGLLIWGCQLEQGLLATSYIPTAGSAVARDGWMMRPPDLGGAPMVQTATGFGMGGGAGIGGNADQAWGHVRCTVGTGPAASGSVVLSFPSALPAAAGGLFVTAEWATITVSGTNPYTLAWTGTRALLPGEVALIAYQWSNAN